MKNYFASLLFLLLTVFCAFGQENEAQKIEEFGTIYCDDYLARFGVMMQTQSKNPNSKVYVFVYEGKEERPVYKNDEYVGSKKVFPTYGLANAKINSMKKLLKIWKGSPDNYVFVNGGFREDFWVEFWLVPNDAEPPKATPTLKKMKYRKGKPYPFCTSCC